MSPFPCEVVAIFDPVIKYRRGSAWNQKKYVFISQVVGNNVQGLRYKFRKIVIDPLFFGQKIIKGCFLSVS